MSRAPFDPHPSRTRGSIRVKILFRGGNEDTPAHMSRLFPGGETIWGECRFFFEREERDYDWLVVYDDLPPRKGERFSIATEELACPKSRTLLITTEPAPIKLYGDVYLAQFGHVLTSQEPWVVRHPGAIFSQPALVWFYGRATPLSYDQLVSSPPKHKTADLSTICSAKRQTHTLHHARYEFTQKLRVLLPDLEVYGHGVRPIVDKSEALDSYRYHIAVENHVCRHHWTEKLSDAFLGLCLPFYYGCPNATDYFPADSLIAIDIADPEGAARCIRAAIRHGEYERRLPAIREARRLVLERYGLFATVADIVARLHPTSTSVPPVSGQTLLSRRALRQKSSLHLLASVKQTLRYTALRRFPTLKSRIK